jgi:hypothetical protein
MDQAPLKMCSSLHIFKNTLVYWVGLNQNFIPEFYPGRLQTAWVKFYMASIMA